LKRKFHYLLKWIKPVALCKDIQLPSTACCSLYHDRYEQDRVLSIAINYGQLESWIFMTSALCIATRYCTVDCIVDSRDQCMSWYSLRINCMII